MTEPSTAPSATQSVPIVDSAAVAPVSSLNATGAKPLPNGAPADDEEDYIIKCVCDFTEDDGKTVLCETCETWQHIVCYYPNEAPGDNDTHECIDCEPRPIDRKRAKEVQHAQLLGIDSPDRKAKKVAAPTKGQKRKPKADQVNGVNEKGDATGGARNGASGSPRDTTQAKRPKGNHRTSHSTTHIIPLKQPAPSRRAASASHALQSPSKNPHHPLSYDIDSYTDDFMHLFDNDPGETALKDNLFGDLKTAGKLSEWCRDPDAVRQDTGGKSHQDVFFRCEQPLDSMNFPLVQKQTKVDDSLEFHGAHPKWVYLTVESETPKNAIVGELRGKIGHMRDYAADEMNRWDELRHPLPFVFFHPTLPIYIDTREQGTLCRYLRRSCQPTVHMKTFLENETDYRFCFVTNKDLPPGSELTISWTPDEHVRKITRELHSEDNKIKQESPEDEEYIREYFQKVLADFGGCACNDPNSCVLRRYKRRKADAKLANGKSKRGRKPGTKQANGRTASSRSGSEALRYQEDDADDDAQSTSASSRSKPQSRDLTPAFGLPSELDALGPDVDDRTKRKIAALEKQENDRHQPATKKKKRNSGAPAVSTGPVSASRATFPDSTLPKPEPKSGGGPTSMPNTPGVTTKSRYVDAGTGQQGSDSPITPAGAQVSSRSKPGSTVQSPSSPTGARRACYLDASTQVDMDLEEAQALAQPRRQFISRNKQFMRRSQHERLAVRQIAGERAAAANSTSPVVGAQLTSSPLQAPTETRDADGDIKMEADCNADSLQNPDDKPKPPSEEVAKPDEEIPDQKRPSSSDETKPLNGFRSADMHVTMPPKPPLGAQPSITIPSTTTPGSAAGVAQSPILQTPSSQIVTPLLTPSGSSLGGPLVQPSPVKKKLSLGDYMSRRTRAEKAEKAEADKAEADKALLAKSESAPSPTTAPEVGSAQTSPKTQAKALPTVTEEATKEKELDAGVAETKDVDAAEKDQADTMDVDPPAATVEDGKEVKTEDA